MPHNLQKQQNRNINESQMHHLSINNYQTQHLLIVFVLLPEFGISCISFYRNTPQCKDNGYDLHESCHGLDCSGAGSYTIMFTFCTDHHIIQCLHQQISQVRNHKQKCFRYCCLKSFNLSAAIYQMRSKQEQMANENRRFKLICHSKKFHAQLLILIL